MRIQEESVDDWRISSYSTNGENCVEVARGETTRVRDTKDREGGELAVTRQAWTALLNTITAE